jgi:hypothetical protein
MERHPPPEVDHTISSAAEADDDAAAATAARRKTDFACFEANIIIFSLKEVIRQRSKAFQ